MRYITYLLTSCLLLVLTTKQVMAQNDYSNIKLLHTIALSGDAKWDYLTVDGEAQRIYVSHGTEVIVLDAISEKVIGHIPNTRGVHGIALATALNKGFISCGKTNSVTVFDLKTMKIIDSIPVTGKKPDAIVYDPATQRVFAFNGGSSNATAIDANTLKVIGTIALEGDPEFAVVDGKGKLYNNLEDKNMLVVINTTTLQVEARYALSPCDEPTGLSIDVTNHRAFSGCRGNKGLTVLDVDNGNVIATLPIGAGVDATVYDPDTHRVYSSNADGTLTVIAQETADTYKVVQTVATPKGSRTMAVNPRSHVLYLPSAEYGTDKTFVPGTFKLIEVGEE